MHGLAVVKALSMPTGFLLELVCVATLGSQVWRHVFCAIVATCSYEKVPCIPNHQL